MTTRLAVCSVVAACAGAGAALAHHSPAAYDPTKEVTIEGTIADLDWRNPHVYLTLQTIAPDGAVAMQEIEVASVSAAQSMGLTRELLAPGTAVVVHALPNRRGAGRTALGLDIAFEDGLVYALNRTGRANGGPPPVPASAPAQSLAGRWTPQRDGLLPIVLGWPLTPAARAAQAATMEGSRPGVSIGCSPLPLPMLMMLTQMREISVSDDTVVIRADSDGNEAVRTIHLDLSEHPASIEPSIFGHSIGHWEGETLVIDTIGFAPHPLGVGFGVPSGEGKHLVERLTLTEDGMGLRYELTVEDPESLSEPAVYEDVWTHRPELAFSDVPCDPENAARYLGE